MAILRHRAPAVCALSLIAVSAAWAAGAPATGDCTLTIHVTGFRNSKGLLGAELFTSSAGWPEAVDHAFRHESFPIEGDHATAVFRQLPAGKYGVVVLHDENENKKLDRNLLQVPKEGFGFGNNPHVLLTAPPLDRASVPVTCPSTTTSIKLIYK